MKKHFFTLIKKTASFIVLLMIVFMLQSSKNNKNQIPLGVTICGSEFGQLKMPGVLNKDYIYPTLSQLKYYALKGIKQIALPFRWERVQQELFGELDPLNMSKIEEVMKYAKVTGIKVILDMHNYGHYRIDNEDISIGIYPVTISAYEDVWKKLAKRFKKYENVLAYQIMAEPHDMGNGVWLKAAQSAINAIRMSDNSTPIIVDGYGWASAHKWQIFSDNLKDLSDVSNKLIYSAHCYFDEDGSGTYAKGYDSKYYHPNIGIEKVKPFVDWLMVNNKKGFVGEYGVPEKEAAWMPIMENFLNYLSENKIGANYWAAGSWWQSYPLSIEPIGGNDKPQMKVLEQFIK